MLLYILLFTASDLASITSHIHNWVLFLLWLHPFILSGVISPLISSSILGTYRPGKFPSVSYHFAFSYCSWGSQGKNTEVVCHSLLQWTTFCQTSPPWPARLGWPYRAWLSFIELEQVMVHVIRLTSFLWLWFQCVCPLMPSPNMLLETSGEITPERMKGWSQSKHNTQLWMWLVIEARSDAVKSNIA